ncbi:hypothetical protein [Leptospira sp. GIMC2001]|uniref:hypothetical protein n=1 Tax=Leptospira sp. GIMC2001 TaxID=1513297 RepID=UPI0023491210|nr:hypothetical protein [Leptospira sp. GIMC2001]WCL50755.1 hypothetical protein O4O04_08065 [Leptospira sp. GIMC2001]
MNDVEEDVFSDSGLSKKVSDHERVIRFFKDSNSYNSRFVKAQAFLPRPNHHTQHLEVSVFRDQSEDIEYWKQRNKEILSNSQLHGFARISVRSIRMFDLELDADDTPPAHANIIQWPIDSDLTLQKAIHKQIAQKLASNAERILYSA